MPSPAAAVDPNAPEVNAAGDIPDNQVFVTYSAPSGSYSIQVPEGWARTVAGGVTTFTDNFNAVRIEEQTTATAPTVMSATAEVTTLAQHVSGFKTGKVSAVTRKGGPAVLITYGDDSPPNQVTAKTLRRDVERYEFWHNGTELIVTLAGPVGADNVDPWRTITDSVRWP